eukprot:6824065-Alexandrium_andersonii.AAC.1
MRGARGATLYLPCDGPPRWRTDVASQFTARTCPEPSTRSPPSGLAPNMQLRAFRRKRCRFSAVGCARARGGRPLLEHRARGPDTATLQPRWRRTTLRKSCTRTI